MTEIQAGSLASDPVGFKTGYLTKQGGRIKTWKRRFFVLDRRNKMISYYKTEQDVTPKGVIHLDGYGVSDDDELKKTNGIKLSKESARTFYITADDAETKESWKTAISECIEGVTPATSIYPNGIVPPGFENDTELSDDDNDETLGWKPSTPSKQGVKLEINPPKSNDPNATLVLDSSDPKAAVPLHPPMDTGVTLVPAHQAPPKSPLPPRSPLPPKPTPTMDPAQTLVPALQSPRPTHPASSIPLSGPTLIPSLQPAAGSGNLLSQMYMNQLQPHYMEQHPTTVAHILLEPHNKFFPTIDCDVVRTIKFGREKRDSKERPDPDFIGFDTKVVSRKHAEIWAVGEEFYIRDTKSQSGTFLNAMRLSLPGEESKPFKIKNGDTLQLGVDYRGGTADNTKCVSFKCTLSMARVNPPRQSSPPPNADLTGATLVAGPSAKMTDLTLVAPSSPGVPTFGSASFARFSNSATIPPPPNNGPALPGGHLNLSDLTHVLPPS